MATRTSDSNADHGYITCYMWLCVCVRGCGCAASLRGARSAIRRWGVGLNKAKSRYPYQREVVKNASAAPSRIAPAHCPIASRSALLDGKTELRRLVLLLVVLADAERIPLREA